MSMSLLMCSRITSFSLTCHSLAHINLSPFLNAYGTTLTSSIIVGGRSIAMGEPTTGGDDVSALVT
jgi:hypothetical protein